MRVLAVDPGREKCGLAVCEPGAVVARRVVPSHELAAVVREWVVAYRADLVLLGDRTGSREVTQQLSGLGVPVLLADERGTTLAARARYFRENPPRGWRRLVPRSFQVPPEPYDDFAAVVLAEAYLAGRLGDFEG